MRRGSQSSDRYSKSCPWSTPQLFCEGRTVPSIRRRVRFDATIRPDLRQLRIAIGWTVREAAGYLHENAPLLQAQEVAGSSADPLFVVECTRKYLGVALKQAAQGVFPILTDTAGTPRVRLLSFALGLELSAGNAILKGIPVVPSRYLEGHHPQPSGIEERAWVAYLDWAVRRYRRLDRRHMVTARMAQQIVRPPAGFTREQAAEVARLANAGRLSPERAE